MGACAFIVDGRSSSRPTGPQNVNRRQQMPTDPHSPIGAGAAGGSPSRPTVAPLVLAVNPYAAARAVTGMRALGCRGIYWPHVSMWRRRRRPDAEQRCAVRASCGQDLPLELAQIQSQRGMQSARAASTTSSKRRTRQNSMRPSHSSARSLAAAAWPSASKVFGQGAGLEVRGLHMPRSGLAPAEEDKTRRGQPGARSVSSSW